TIFKNHKKRPDIVVKGNSTFSITGTQKVDNESQLNTTDKILIIELKRGGFKLTRDERNQAANYVEDFLSCGTIIGTPYINAFVVGETFNEKIQPIHSIKDESGKENGKVQICLFSQIVDSAEARLFNLRKRLNERYDDIPGMELYQRQAKLAI